MLSQDEIDTQEIEQSATYFRRPMRVIRSHRRKPDVSPRKLLIVITVIGVASTGITRSATHSDPLEAPVIHIAAAPDYVLPDDTQIREEIEREIPKIVEQRQLTAETSSRMAQHPKPPATSKIETVIAFAMSQRGKPYVWGAAGPNSYDCSGLVMLVFAHAGVSLPHYTGAMMGRGTTISKSQLKRGDVVFPSSGHVGIYLGKGKFIYASSGKGKVIVATLYDFYTARRLL